MIQASTYSEKDRLLTILADFGFDRETLVGKGYVIEVDEKAYISGKMFLWLLKEFGSSLKVIDKLAE